MNTKPIILPFLVFLSLLFTANNAFSQSKVMKMLNRLKPFGRSVFLNQNVYKTIDELEVQKVYNNNTKRVVSDVTKYKINPSNGNFIRYRVINDDESIIRVLPLTKFNQVGGNNTIEYREKGETSTINDDPSDYYFKIVDELTTPAKKFLATEHLTAIPITIPLKYRLKAYDTDSKFTFDANISYGFGYKFRVTRNPYKERYIRGMFAIGGGLQEYMPRDSINSETFKPENELTFTYSVGTAYEVGSNLNFGIFLGWDRMFGREKDWYYQNKPWLGIGIGYKFD